MNKLVTRINWVNDTDPAINDTHLNQMDSELDAIDDRVIGLEGACEAQAEEAEAWAVGERGGEAVQSSDPTYHNNSKYYSQQASNSATNAGTSETNAGNSATAAGNSALSASNKALVSEGYANGTQNGNPVTSGSPYYENNAKYWKEQAQQIAGASLGGLSDVTITTPSEGQALIYDAANGIWRNSSCNDSQSVNGNPLSITADSAQVARSTTITLNPIQAAGTPTPSNPIPIYGYDNVDLRACGVNQWDEEWEAGTFDGGTGEPITYADRIRSKNFCVCTGNTSFYAKIGFSVSLKVFWYDSNKSFISAQVLANTTITSPVQATYFKITVEGSTYGETYRNDISINYPSSDTTYYAYTEAADISLPLPETVYGGTLDVETGVLKVTHKGVDMGDLSWTYYSPDQIFYTDGLTDILASVQPLCSIYPYQYNTNKSFWVQSNNKRTFVKDLDYTDGAVFKTAVTGQKIVYELATPHTIQLTPHQVRLLEGANVITSNGLTISLVYRTGRIATLEDLDGVAKTINETVEIANGTKSADKITAGTFDGQVKANATAQANLGTAQVRNIIVTDTAPTVGSSTTIPDGTLIIVYE